MSAKMILCAVSSAAAILCTAAGVEFDAVYTVPGELDCLVESGHVQGACCSENAVYLSHARGIEKISWNGRLLKHADAPGHLGDTAFANGRIYGVFAIRDRKLRKDGKPGLVRVWNENLEQIAEAWFDETFDGVTVLGDTVYTGAFADAEGSGYGPHSSFKVKRLGLDLSDRGTVEIPSPFSIHYGVQTMTTDGESIFCGMYGGPADKGNPKRLNFIRLTPELTVAGSLKFPCAEGIDRVPRSVAKRETPVFFVVRAMGGNMQGWRKDPANNPPRIRLEFYEYAGGEFKFITKKPIVY